MYHRHTYYSDMVDRETAVYRFFDIDGTLLYVGLTMNMEARLAKHRRRAWWPQVAETKVVWYDGREAAKAAEKLAIRDENPVHNITRPKVGAAQ